MTAERLTPPDSDRSWFRNPSLLAEILAGFSVRHPWLVIILSAVLTLVSGYYAATHFAITTETDQLLESDNSWGRDREAFKRAFPQLDKTILVVIDGATPEATDAAAEKLTAKLAAEPRGALKGAWRPDGGDFFNKNGLLFLSLDQVRATVDELVKQQPTLSALSGDPSLRGLMRLIQLGAGRGMLEQNATLVDRMTAVIESVLAGQPARFSWQTAMSGRAPEPNELRKFILVDPVFNYELLEPAAAASARIRGAARELGLGADKGVKVRLTGVAPLADEEFATVSEGAPLHLGLTVVAIAVLLWLALRSGRVILPVLATTLVGLVVTIGVGLWMVGRFNVISVAVAALFLGLGVDFAIQFAVRYRDERFRHDDVAGAIHKAARGIGWSLTLAAAALLAGFFSFLPTSFKGVSELGLITGVGMIIAFLASLTLLPAMITVLRPKGEDESVENQSLLAVDHWILAHRKLVILVATGLVVAGLPFLFKLEFDANPMHLRSDKTESVATFLDLTRQPGFTPNTLSVLAPNAEAGRRLVTELEALPEVSRVVSVQTFVPGEQDAKLALIRAGALNLESLINPLPPAPAPTDAELVAAIKRTADTLRRYAEGDGVTKSDTAVRLVPVLNRLAEADPAKRATVQEALTGDLPLLLTRIGALMTAEPVTLDTIPATIKNDWVGRDGLHRLEVSPKGDANDNAVLERFAQVVQAIAPAATGAPLDVVESRKIIVKAFMTAGLLALGLIFVILAIALRHPKDVALTLGPLVIATIMTLEAAYLVGMPLNLANIIALPLMLAVGVNFHIYYMILWRDGVQDMLASSLTRAIFFSALVTGIAFGSLWLSHHPGTASMGKLLTISLVFTLLAAFVVVPAFLGPPRQPKDGAKPKA